MPTSYADRFQALKNDMKGVIDVVSQGPGAQPGTIVIKLTGKWFDTLPDLARSCANAVEVAPDLFPGLKITHVGMRELIAEVHDIDDLLVYIQQWVNQLLDIQRAKKAQLYDCTMLVVDQLKGLQVTPLLSAETKKKVDEVAAPVMKVLDDRNGSIVGARKNNAKLRTENQTAVAEAEAKAAAAEKEARVLRGGKLSVPPAPSAPRTPRTRRTPRRSAR